MKSTTEKILFRLTGCFAEALCYVPYRQFFLMLMAGPFLLASCVIDKTGQSRSLTLQQDLALTHTQVQSLQRQVDDQLSHTSAKLVQAEENAQLNRRNLADSGALLTSMVTDMQALRGTFEEISQQVRRGDKRLEQFQTDIDFRLEEFEKRLVAMEQMIAQLNITLPETPNPAADVQAPVDDGESIDADETLKRARKYFEAGDYKISQAFLKEFRSRFPTSPGREEAQFLLAESLLRDGEAVAAIQAFQTLIEDFPKSKRVPTVMLRQGEAFLALGEKDDAKLFFSELVHAYPDSEDAAKAKAHLDEMGP